MSCTKERLLAVERIILSKRTASTQEILDELSRTYDINADRKTIYDDIAALTYFIPIVMAGSGNSVRYSIDEEGKNGTE